MMILGFCGLGFMAYRRKQQRDALGLISITSDYGETAFGRSFIWTAASLNRQFRRVYYASLADIVRPALDCLREILVVAQDGSLRTGIRKIKPLKKKSHPADDPAPHLRYPYQKSQKGKVALRLNPPQPDALSNV